MGLFGFLFARNAILEEWEMASSLKLERAAHHIDMRLGRPLEWIKMFNKTGRMMEAYAVQEWIVEQLNQLEGVSKVDLKWMDPVKTQEINPGMSGMGLGRGRRGMMRFNRARISEVTPPRHDAQIGHDTVSLVSNFKDKSGNLIATLEVAIRFDHLLQDIQTLGWWQSDLAGLVDVNGQYLAHTETMSKGHIRLGETDDFLEMTLLKVMKEKPFGTLRGPGRPPKRVIGFYRLEHAPWTIVIFAPGHKILKPIIRFRTYFFIAGSLCILLIVILIRFVVGKTARNISGISRAAEEVAGGIYGDPLPITSGDEIGQLTQSFNKMVQGLKEKDLITNTFGRYVDPEIAKELMQRPEATRLGGEKREVAILISDIRGFTPLSETLDPQDVISLLNRYFSHIIGIIRKYQGIIVDFFGDGVLVFFDPLEGPVEPKIQQCVHCALEMQANMASFNEEMRDGGLPELEMGIGVNVGEVVVGNIGSEARAKYGIVGSPVNITQRIQSMAKGGEVVISDTVHRQIRDDLRIHKTFSVTLKGVQDMMTLHVLTGR